MADAVQVEFGANTSGIDQGAAAVSSKLKQLQDQTDGMASQFTAFGQKMGAAFDDAATSLVHFDTVLKSLNDTIQKGGNVSAASGIIGILSKAPGIGIAIAAVAGLAEGVHILGEEMIKLEQHANETGVSIERFQLLQSAFNAAGVSTDKVVSGLDALSKKLTDAKYDAGKFGEILDANNVKWKDSKDNVLSTEAIMRELSLVLQRAVAEGGAPLARKFGESVGLSQELVRVLQQGPVALDMMLKKAKELGGGLDAEVVHKAADFQREWNAASSNMATWLKAQLQGLLPAIQEWAKAVGQAIAKVFSDIFKQLKGIFQDVTAEWAGDIDTFAGRFGAAEGSITKLATRAKDVSTAFRQAGSDLDGLVATGKQFEAIKFPDKGKDKFDPTAMIEFRTELDKIKEKYQEQKITEQSAVDTFKQTETAKVEHLKTALAQRETAENAVLAEMLMKYGDNAKERARIELEAQKLIHERQLDEDKLDAELLKKKAQEWRDVLSTISGAFTSQLRGILQGTTTWAQAMKNIMLDLVLKIIDEFIKLAIIQPLVQGFLKAGFAAPTEIFSTLLKIIGSMFGPLFAGFTAFFAPVQGPAAPAEGAAAAAATVAIAAAAVQAETGTDYVPRTGMALIHQGETIIPASEGVGGPYTGGRSGHSFNINLSAIDVPSFNGWLRNGGGDRMLAKMISDIMNKNPTLRPSY